MKTTSHLAAVKAVVIATCLLTAVSPCVYAASVEEQAAAAARNSAQATKNAAQDALAIAAGAMSGVEDDIEDAQDDIEDAIKDVEDAVEDTQKAAAKANKSNAKQKDIDKYNEALADEQAARNSLQAAQNALTAAQNKVRAYDEAQDAYADAVQALEAAEQALANAVKAAKDKEDAENQQMGGTDGKNDKYDENGNDATDSQADLADNGRIPPDPVGWLTAYPTIVQTGTKPTLTWSITYPSIVKDYIDIIPPGTIDPKEKLDVEVRVLGNGVTVSTSNSNSFSFVAGEASLSFNGNGYQRIFYGDNHDVNPSTVVWSQKNVQAGQRLKFGGRYYYNGWGPYYNSDSGTQNVRLLVNGDTPPSNIPDHNAPSLEDFIKPYLGGDGKVNIGPMDVIVFMELTHTDNQQNNSGYDLQDMVLLVTFTSNNPKNNNGHGNNADGVDSSNPGNAPFMQYDSDPTVDDEAGGGGAYPSNP